MGKRRSFKDFFTGATARGVFVFPHLTEPDFRFDAEFGQFNVSLDLEGEDAEALIEIIDEHAEKEYRFICEEKGKTVKRYDNLPYGPATDRDKNEIPGVTRFRFTRKAGGRYSPKHSKAGETWSSSFPLYAASGTELVTEPIFGGTEGRVSYQIQGWYTPSLGAGIRLSIEAIKVTNLVTSGGTRSQAAYHFEDEDGYVPEAKPVATSTPDVETEDELETTQGGVEF
jgi:hypothetical protein